MHLSPLAFLVESLAPGYIFQHDPLDRDNALTADGGDVINDDAGEVFGSAELKEYRMRGSAEQFGQV